MNEHNIPKKDLIVLAFKQQETTHNWVSKPSNLGVVSSYAICTRCKAYRDIATPATRDCKLIDLSTYLLPPKFKHEEKPICSEQQFNRAIKETKQTILKYLHRHRKHNIPRTYIAGSSSLLSQVNAELLNEGLITIDENNIVRLCQEM